NAGPGLSILAYDRAVADRLTFGKHVVNVACGGIDQDRAWRFLAVVSDDLPPIGGRNPRLPGGRARQVPPIARREIRVRHGHKSKPRTADHGLAEALAAGPKRLGAS